MAENQELRRLAEAATPGEWETRSISRRFRPVHEILGVFGKSDVVANMDGIAVPDRMNDRSFEEDAANMRYIAAASPSRVIALLDRIEALEKALDRMVATYTGMEDGDGNPCPDVEFARAALAGEQP